MRGQTCCFTGHRHLPPGEREKIAGKLEDVIVALCQQGIRYYGAGVPWDLMPSPPGR